MAKKADATALLEPNTIVQPVSEAQSPVNDALPPSRADEITPNSAETTPISVVIEAPMGHCDLGYAAKRIDFRGMTRRQSAAAKRLFISLGRANERITVNGPSHPDGKPIVDQGDAVRWLFEKLADQWEEETGLDITAGLSFHGD
jgi:hypothetical protein